MGIIVKSNAAVKVRGGRSLKRRLADNWQLYLLLIIPILVTVIYKIWLDVWHRTDFENAASEQEALWIKDGGPDDKAWEKYLKTLDRCGMNELLEVYQAAYDRYAAAQ